MHLQPKRLGTGARILLPSLVAAAFLGACSGSATSAPYADDESYPAAASAAPATAGAPADGEAQSLAGGDPGKASGVYGRQDDTTNQALQGRLIIRTGSVSIQVTGIDAALAKAQEIVTAAGGYVASGQRSGDADRATATITYRIPVDRFEATLSSLRGVADKLLSEQIGSDEVTAQVVDLGARLTNLRASETALQKIMEQATKIPDILAVQQQLATTRDEIERLVAQKQSLEQQAAMATLTVNYSLPPTVAVQTVSEGWDPASVVDRAVATMVEFGQGIVEFAIWFGIVILPTALILGIPSLVVFVIVRRRLRRRPHSGQGGTSGGTTGAEPPAAASAAWPAG